MLDKEYISSGACIQCSLGTRSTKLNVLPTRSVILSGNPMGNVSDHISIVNIPSFGRCRSLAYPPTASATAAANGKLTPMPCIPGTMSDWMRGKDDYIICNSPALKTDSKCRCQFGGVVTLKSDGQTGCGTTDVVIENPLEFSIKEHKFNKNISSRWSSDEDAPAPTKELTAEEETEWKRKYHKEVSKLNDELILLNNLIAAEDPDEYHTLINNDGMRPTDVCGDNGPENHKGPYGDDADRYDGYVKDEDGNITLFGYASKGPYYDNIGYDSSRTEKETNVLVKLLSDLIGMMRPIKNTKCNLIIDFDALIGGVTFVVSFGYDGSARRYLQLEYSSWMGLNWEMQIEKGKSIGEFLKNIARKAGRKVCLVKFFLQFEENAEQPLYDWLETFIFLDINIDVNNIVGIKVLDEYDTGMRTNSISVEGALHLPGLDVLIKWDPDKLDNGQAGFTVTFSKELLKEDERPIGLKTLERKKIPYLDFGFKFGPKFRYTWQLENLIEKVKNA